MPISSPQVVQLGLAILAQAEALRAQPEPIKAPLRALVQALQAQGLVRRQEAGWTAGEVVSPAPGWAALARAAASVRFAPLQPLLDPVAASVRYLPGAKVPDQPCDLLVNTVNVVGVMGKGVAKDFATRWPSILQPYRALCSTGTFLPGTCVLFPLPDGRRWAGLATKAHWRDPSRPEWVRSGLLHLAEQAQAAGVTRIAISAPGCSQGGLEWRQVHPWVLDALAAFDLRITAPDPQERAA